MLARVHRVVSGADYRRVVRYGSRVTTAHAVVYRMPAPSDETRFGFIVSKAVGNAVARNQVRRRLKAISARMLPHLNRGTDVVVRALPGSAEASWVTLNSEITEALNRGQTRV